MSVATNAGIKDFLVKEFASLVIICFFSNCALLIFQEHLFLLFFAITLLLVSLCVLQFFIQRISMLFYLLQSFVFFCMFLGAVFVYYLMFKQSGSLLVFYVKWISFIALALYIISRFIQINSKTFAEAVGLYNIIENGSFISQNSLLAYGQILPSMFKFRFKTKPTRQLFNLEVMPAVADVPPDHYYFEVPFNKNLALIPSNNDECFTIVDCRNRNKALSCIIGKLPPNGDLDAYVGELPEKINFANLGLYIKNLPDLSLSENQKKALSLFLDAFRGSQLSSVHSLASFVAAIGVVTYGAWADELTKYMPSVLLYFCSFFVITHAYYSYAMTRFLYKKQKELGKWLISV
ncbi:MAG: hypothetical protein KAT71_06335 [Gammaproteobacteria bacterium]|nr:hypothetical protein [Gammaproteobacteria bacterium]